MADIIVQQGGGGDYTTLSAACNNANASDVIKIQGTWSSADTTACIVADDSLIIQIDDASSAHPGYDSDVDHYRLRVSGSHAITVNNTGCVISGLVIMQNGTGSSDECVRMAASGGTLTVNKAIVCSNGTTADQDGIYAGDLSCTVNVNETISYNFDRACFHAQPFGAASRTQTWNLRSCVAINGGIGDTDGGGGITARAVATETTTSINAFNCLCLENNGNVSAEDYRNGGETDNGTRNWTIHQCFDSDGSIANRDASAVNCQGSMNLTDDNTKASDGDWVIVEETASGSEDFRLQDNTYNEAQDYSATATGAGMTISGTTDIVGTSRPQDTNYDVGAFELVVTSGVTVNATLGTIAIAGNDTSMSVGTSIAATKGEVAIGGLNASISVGVGITATKGEVSISGINPVVSLGVLVEPNVGNINISGLNPAMSVGTAINATSGAVTISGLNTVIDLGITIEPNTGVVVIGGLNPTILAGTEISATIGEIDISGINPIVSLATDITPNTGTINITAINPTIGATVEISAETGEVIISGLSPVVTIGAIPEVPTIRTLAILAESRTMTIEQENRIYQIQ